MSVVTTIFTIKLILVFACFFTIFQSSFGQEPSFGQWTPFPMPGTLDSRAIAQQPSNDDPFGEDDPFNESFNKTSPPNAPVALKSLADFQSKTQKIIADSAPAVVAIDETGSGVVVSSNGIVLTASHVTRVAHRKVSVAFADGRVVQGITLGSNIASDTGAIQLLSPGPFPFISVKDSKDAVPGSWCIAMGYPLSFPRGKPAAGRLGRVLSREGNGKLITDCTIMGGDSGGPLLNLDGKVIAISSSVKLGIDQNLHIPSEQFLKDWKNIALSIDKTSLPTNKQPFTQLSQQSGKGFKITKRPSGKAYLGINAETDQNFVRIRAVHRQSPAEFAGVQANDVIVEMDSVAITSFAQIVKLLKLKKPGDQISILINRYGSLIRTNVRLGGNLQK